MDVTKKDMNLTPEVKEIQEVDVLPINSKKALEAMTPEERQEVVNLAQSIDVTMIENVMNYGSNILTQTFDQCRSIS